MVLAARRFEHRRAMARIDAEVDRARWLMPPQMVNAYYHPMLNEIVFPAAILQVRRCSLRWGGALVLFVCFMFYALVLVRSCGRVVRRPAGTAGHPLLTAQLPPRIAPATPPLAAAVLRPGRRRRAQLRRDGRRGRARDDPRV